MKQISLSLWGRRIAALVYLVTTSFTVQANPSEISVLGSDLERAEHSDSARDSMRRRPTQHEMVLSIQSVEGDANGTVASKGVLIQRYINSRTYRSSGIGDSRFSDQTGTYRFTNPAHNVAIEYLADSGSNERIVTKYQFERANFGRFERRILGTGITLKGQFSYAPTQLPEVSHLAESSHNGLTVAVNILAASSAQVPKGQYPERALVLQRYYDDARYTAVGFGPATIPHSGTFQYQKVSANVAIEQTTQVTDYFTLPFVMVYFYETPTSGVWYQDFGDGLIKFSGIFSTFQTTEGQ